MVAAGCDSALHSHTPPYGYRKLADSFEPVVAQRLPAIEPLLGSVGTRSNAYRLTHFQFVRLNFADLALYLLRVQRPETRTASGVMQKSATQPADGPKHE